MLEGLINKNPFKQAFAYIRGPLSYSSVANVIALFELFTYVPIRIIIARVILASRRWWSTNANGGEKATHYDLYLIYLISDTLGKQADDFANNNNFAHS